MKAVFDFFFFFFGAAKLRATYNPTSLTGILDRIRTQDSKLISTQKNENYKNLIKKIKQNFMQLCQLLAFISLYFIIPIYRFIFIF